MGSTRALRTGPAHGNRQNALTEGTRRSPAAKIERIIAVVVEESGKRKAERNAPVGCWRPGAQLEGLYTVLEDYVGPSIPAVRTLISFSDYEI